MHRYINKNKTKIFFTLNYYFLEVLTDSLIVLMELTFSLYSVHYLWATALSLNSTFYIMNNPMSIT